jgi:Tfp pilus assembly protein PilO
MEETLKQEVEKLNTQMANLEAGRKQITQMEQEAFRTDGRISILKELIAKDKKQEED